MDISFSLLNLALALALAPVSHMPHFASASNIPQHPAGLGSGLWSKPIARAGYGYTA